MQLTLERLCEKRDVGKNQSSLRHRRWSLSRRVAEAPVLIDDVRLPKAGPQHQRLTVGLLSLHTLRVIRFR
jgi:hypothetical protein